MSDIIARVLRGHRHAESNAPELFALDKVAPHLKKMKRSIMEAAHDAVARGERGIIPDEQPGLINTVRRRFTDLHIEGHLRPTEHTKENASGNPVTVWEPGRDFNMLATRESKEQKIARLEARVAELERMLRCGESVPF